MSKKKSRDGSGDRSLIEISNDEGDHWVADIPTSGVKAIEKELRNAGVERDRDDQLSRQYNAAEKVDKRDKEQHRYRSESVVNPNEDLEPEVDNDSILEADEQPATHWWSF